jgi:hypothetical protein
VPPDFNAVGAALAVAQHVQEAASSHLRPLFADETTAVRA